MSDKIDAVIASMGWDLDPQEWADMRRLCEAVLAEQPAPAVPADAVLRARIADLLHLLQFAKIETPSCGDAKQAELAMIDLGHMLAAAPAAPVAVQEPVAWMRKWALNGEKPVKVKGEKGRMVTPFKFKFCELTTVKCLPDDVPLYTAPPAALAQQPATAVPDGWIPVSARLPSHGEPVQVWCSGAACAGVAWMRQGAWYMPEPQALGYETITHWQPLAAAPAAPVAQEPAAWPAAAHDLVRDWQTGMASSNEVCIALASAGAATWPAAAHDLVRDWQTGMASSNDVCIALASALCGTPPAAEQPECPPGHELVALPIDRIEREYVPCGSLDLAVKMLDIGLAFALCNRDHAGTRRDVKKAQRYVEEISQLLAAEQPDTVKVPRAVLKITEQMLQFYLARLYCESAEGCGIRAAEAAAAELRALLAGSECSEMVYASDYDALAQRCRELEHAATNDLLTRLLDQLDASNAKNYHGAEFDVDLGSEQMTAVVMLQRRGHPSAHDLRLQAEAQCDTLRAEVERLRKNAERLEKAEKDAARYQHLERQGHFRAMSIDMGGNHSWTGIGRHIGKGPTIEEAIDAAIAQEGQSHE